MAQSAHKLPVMQKDIQVWTTYSICIATANLLHCVNFFDAFIHKWLYWSNSSFFMYLRNTFYSVHSHSAVLAFDLHGLPPMVLDTQPNQKSWLGSQPNNLLLEPPSNLCSYIIWFFSSFLLMAMPLCNHRSWSSKHSSSTAPATQISITNDGNTESLEVVHIELLRFCNCLLKDIVGILPNPLLSLTMTTIEYRTST